MTSIILLTRDQLELTKLCIKSIIAHTDKKKTPYEIIIVDNASTDGTRKYLEDLKEIKFLNVKTIYNDKNEGFPKANNQGAAIAEGENILLINNDCVVTDGWLEKMLRVLNSGDNIAAVGPYTSRAASIQQINPAHKYKDDATLQAYAKAINNRLSLQDTGFLVFFCVLIKRKVWDVLGGLDEDFSPGNYEDNYFCRKALEKKYILKIADCYVHHFGSATWLSALTPREREKKNQEFIELMGRNQKKFYKKLNNYKRISLCMIVADYEKPELLERGLKRISPFVDEINIVFNYKYFPRRSKVRKLLAPMAGTIINFKYEKWTDFSEMRNLSLDMATGDYVLWLDTDDVIKVPELLRMEIEDNPEVDSFKCRVLCVNEIKGQEVILHNRLLRNDKKYRFRNKVHEDITFSLMENKANTVLSSIVIDHTGYAKWADTIKKNKRNYEFLKKEIVKPEAHSLTYFAIINSLIILGGRKNLIKAIKYVDEAIDKFKMKDTDPLLPKLWVMRGLCCMSCGQQLAAKQSFHKAYDEWQHPEAVVNLAEIYIREKNYDKAIEILSSLEKKGGIDTGNIPFDVKHIERLMWFKLAECYAHKGDYEKAEGYYRKCIFVTPNDLLALDRLAQILRITGRAEEAAKINIFLINRFPTYHVGWFNAAQFELANKRFQTAKVFLKRAVELNPRSQEALHNLRQLELMKI